MFYSNPKYILYPPYSFPSFKSPDRNMKETANYPSIQPPHFKPAEDFQLIPTSGEAATPIHKNITNKKGRLQLRAGKIKERHRSDGEIRVGDEFFPSQNKENNSNKGNNKPHRNKHYYAKPKEQKPQSKHAWYDLPSALKNKTLVKYSFEMENYPQNKLHTPGPGSYNPNKQNHQNNLQSPTFYFLPKPEQKQEKKQPLAQEKNDELLNGDVIIVSYDKMTSSFFKTTLDSVNYSNRDLLEKILSNSKKKTKFSSTEQEEYIYQKRETPAPNHYSTQQSKGDNNANYPFSSKTEKIEEKIKSGPGPFSYSINQQTSQKIKHESSFFASTTERFPIFLPPHNQYQCEKGKPQKEKTKMPQLKKFPLSKTSSSLMKSEKQNMQSPFQINKIRKSLKTSKEKELKMLSLIEKIHQRRSNDISLSEDLKSSILVSIHQKSDTIFKQKLQTILEKQFKKSEFSAETNSKMKTRYDIGFTSNRSHHCRKSTFMQKVQGRKQPLFTQFVKCNK